MYDADMYGALFYDYVPSILEQRRPHCPDDRARATGLFVRNIPRWARGEELENEVHM